MAIDYEAFRYNFFAADNRLISLLPCISQFSIIAAKLPHRIQSQGSCAWYETYPFL